MNIKNETISSVQKPFPGAQWLGILTSSASATSHRARDGDFSRRLSTCLVALAVAMFARRCSTRSQKSFASSNGCFRCCRNATSCWHVTSCIRAAVWLFNCWIPPSCCSRGNNACCRRFRGPFKARTGKSPSQSIKNLSSRVERLGKVVLKWKEAEQIVQESLPETVNVKKENHGHSNGRKPR
jgi:hypothetical protein